MRACGPKEGDPDKAGMRYCTAWKYTRISRSVVFGGSCTKCARATYWLDPVLDPSRPPRILDGVSVRRMFTL